MGVVSVVKVREAEVPSFRRRPRPRLTLPDGEVVDAKRGEDVTCLRGRPGPRFLFTRSSEDGAEGTGADPLRDRSAGGTIRYGEARAAILAITSLRILAGPFSTLT